MALILPRTYPPFLLLLFLLAHPSLQTCYFPSGYDANAVYISNNQPQLESIPCNNDTTSMCCPTAAHCLSSGICDHGGGNYTRQSCTDQSWQDPACVNLFVDGEDSAGHPLSNESTFVTSCDDGSWCLGLDNKACCSQHQGLAVVSGTVLLATETATSMTATGTSAATASPTASSQPPPAHDNHVGAIAGGVVGGLAGLTIVLSAVWFLVRRNNRQAAGFHGPRPQYMSVIQGVEPSQSRTFRTELPPGIQTLQQVKGFEHGNGRRVTAEEVNWAPMLRRG